MDSKAKKKEQFLEMMHSRHACKEFDQRKIPEDDLKYILEAGRLSPSSFGVEQWKFVVVQNQAIKEKIEAASWGQKQISTSSDLVVVVARKDVRSSDDYVKSQIKRWGLEQSAYEGVMEIYKAWVDGREDSILTLWSEKQCYIAAANMMSAAKFIGIDSCPIEGFDANKVNEILNLDANFHTALLLPFGYCNKKARKKFRLDFEDVVRFV